MRAITLLTLLVATTGCDEVKDALTPSQDGEANAAVESTELTRLEASLLIAIAEVTPLDVDPAAQATAVEAALPMVFSPADCVQSEITGESITADLDGCTGPRAFTITGVVNIAFDAGQNDSTELSVTAGNVQIEGMAVTIRTTTVLPADLATGRELEVSTGGGGAGEGDGALSGRIGTYTVSYDESCLRLDGRWTSSLDTRLFQSVVSDFHRCGEACPTDGRIIYGETDAEQAAGGAVDIDGLTVSFDGSDVATYISTELSAGRVQLDCRAAN